MQNILLCIALCGYSSLQAFNYTLLEPLLNQYTRPVTVLEVKNFSNDCCTPFLARRYVGTFIAMVKHDADALIKIIEQTALHNVVVTHPQNMSHELFTTLSRCEHFDLVIVHDLLKMGTKSVKETLNLALTLADHVLISLTSASAAHLKSIDCPYEIIGPDNNNTLYLFHPGKDSIQQPRWNKNTSSLRYSIKSTFHDKKLHKNDAPEGSNWTSGINLITFVMLNGLYPTDAIIREHLNAFYEIQHNDLVVGNMVVQGSHIAPIDAHDPRRYLDQKLCLKAALSLFSWGKRFKNPEHELYKYSIYIQSRSKKNRK